MDIDDKRNEEWIKRCNIKEIPAIVIFDNKNKEKSRKIGYKGVDQLLSFLKKHR